jgi:hypothetical protein
MPGIFLSHTSVDKSFVFRLAIDLVNGGFPVWLDAWEMSVGDQLYDHIYDGIDDSSFLIVVLSQKSVESTWVNDEINGALNKEAQNGRKFLIPIKLEDCKIPLKIAGRIYADFSSSYFEGLDGLLQFLRSRGVDKISIPPQKALIPLELFHGLFLNRVAFEKRLRALKGGRKDFLVSPSQFVLSPEESYTALRKKLLRTLEKSRSDPEFTVEDREYIQYAYHGVQSEEAALLGGVADIVNRFPNDLYMGEAGAWFVKLVRNSLYATMYAAQRKIDAPILKTPEQCVLNMFASKEDTAKFFEVPGVAHLTVFRTDNGETCGVWLDKRAQIFEDLDVEGYRGQVNYPLSDLPRDLVFKFIIPQIVHFSLGGRNFSSDWSLAKCRIRED